MVWKFPSSIRGVNYIMFFVFFCLVNFTQAQTVIRNFTVDDGLPSNEVHYVHQDKHGYLWFCTDRGISRYNGYEFTNFTTEDGLTSNIVFKCFEDWDGNLWFTTMDGSITIYDIKDRFFHPFHSNSWLKKRFRKQKWVHKVAFSKTSKEVCLVMLDNSNIDSVYLFDDQVFLKPLSGDYFFEKNKNVFTNLEFLGQRKYKNRVKYLSLLIKNGAIVNNEEINQSILKLDKWNSEILGSVPAFSWLDEKLYVSCPEGTFTVDSHGNLCPYYTGIASTCIYKDNQGLYWLTSMNKGVFLLSSSDITNVSTSLNLPGSKKLVSAAGRGENIVVGTDNRLIYLLREDGEVLEQFKLQNPKYKSVYHFLFNTDSSEVYYGDFELKWGRNSYYSRPLEEMTFVGSEVDFKHNLLVDLDTTGSGNLTYENTVGYYSRTISVPILKFFNKYSKFREYHNTLMISTCFKNCLIDDSSMFVADRFGLYRIFKDDNKNIEEICLDASKISISDFDVLENLMFVSTKGSGVKVLNKDKIVATITESDGLVSDMVNTLWLDTKKKQVWCGTNKGITVFEYDQINSDIRFKKIKNIRKEDGLYSNYINAITASENNIVALSDAGLSLIPNKLKYHKGSAPVVNMLGVVQEDSLYSISGISLSYDENNLEFRYEAVSNRKIANMYRYRLVTGRDTGAWEATDVTRLRINNMAPASYVFQVCARAQNAEWSALTEYRVTISPRFIDRWWVRVLALLLLALVVFDFVKRREKRIKKSSKLSLLNKDLELQNTNLDFKNLKLQAASLRRQMNPHFVFNVLNSIQRLILEERSEDANELLGEFATLIRSALMYSRLEYLSINDEIKFLETYLAIEMHRFPERFTYSLQVGENLQGDEQIPSLLIQTLCENAIKHGFTKKRGKLTVGFERIDDSLLQIRVSDDGVGYYTTVKGKASNNTSLGLEIIESRINILKKEGYETSYSITPLSEETKEGTVVTLVVPYKTNAKDT